MLNSSPPIRATVSDSRIMERTGLPHVEQTVAEIVAERIIDLLKTVEIEKENRELAFVPARLCDLEAQHVEEQSSVRKSGERIVQRHLPDLFLARLWVSDVSEIHFQTVVSRIRV